MPRQWRFRSWIHLRAQRNKADVIVALSLPSNRHCLWSVSKLHSATTQVFFRTKQSWKVYFKGFFSCSGEWSNISAANMLVWYELFLCSFVLFEVYVDRVDVTQNDRVAYLGSKDRNILRRFIFVSRVKFKLDWRISILLDMG